MAKRVDKDFLLAEIKETLKAQSRVDPTFLTRSGLPFLGQGNNLEFYLDIDRNLARRLQEQDLTKAQSNLFLRSVWGAGSKFADWTDMQRSAGFNQAVISNQLLGRFQGLMQNLSSYGIQSQQKLQQISRDLEKIRDYERGFSARILSSDLLKKQVFADLQARNQAITLGNQEYDKVWGDLFDTYNISDDQRAMRPMESTPTSSSSSWASTVLPIVFGAPGFGISKLLEGGKTGDTEKKPTRTSNSIPFAGGK